LHFVPEPRHGAVAIDQRVESVYSSAGVRHEALGKADDVGSLDSSVSDRLLRESDGLFRCCRKLDIGERDANRTREPAVREVGATPQACVRYWQLSFRSLIDITRNCGSGLSVFTVSLDFVSGASSRSTLVSVLVLDSPAGIIKPVTSTL
jgi:hypothetical protein